jgi:hypothetical protein
MCLAGAYRRCVRKGLNRGGSIRVGWDLCAQYKFELTRQLLRKMTLLGRSADIHEHNLSFRFCLAM